MVKVDSTIGITVRFIKRHKIALVVLAALLAVLIIAAGTITALAVPEDGKIANGVRVNGINVGGMTVAQAETAISAIDYYDGSFRLVADKDTVTVDRSDISLGVDAKRTAVVAYDIGRSNSFIKNFVQAVKLLAVGTDITASPAVDIEALDKVIFDMGVRINGEAKPASIEEISENEIRVFPPTGGQDKNVEHLRTNVLNELQNKGAGCDIRIEFTADKTHKITAEELYSLVKRDAADASYTIDGKNLSFTSEVIGRDVQMSEITQKLEAFNNGEPIQLTITTVMPEVTLEALNNDLFNTELASYSSNYSSSGPNRAFNVARAAASANGAILLPGDVFSYNDAIGNPSLANGYKIASVFASGKQTEGAGGGVCQVSSTIYSAVLYANLEIVERRSHSLTVAYVPKGQDATVAYGVLDFKFRNNYDTPIKLEVTASGGICKVRILGTKQDVTQKVELAHSVVAVNNPVDNITYDDTLPEGTRKVVSKGKTGYVVDSVRKVFENGVLVKTEPLTRSNYQMVPNEVTVGSKVAEITEPSVPATTPETTPEPDTVPATPEEPPKKAPDSDAASLIPDTAPTTPEPEVIPDSTPVLSETSQAEEIV